MAEAKYYLIQGLVNMCQTALQVRGQGWRGLMHRELPPPFLVLAVRLMGPHPLGQ